MARFDVKNLKLRLQEMRAVHKPAKPASGARFVFFLGDEGVILIHLKGNEVLSRHFVSNLDAENIKPLQQVLDTDKKAPIMLVVDTLDQSYLQQNLPPVSSLSVKKLIKRRLERDFSNSDIKGAVLLGREKTGRRDWNFMMIGLERSHQLNSCLDFIIAQPNRFQGIYMLSVETENIVKQLDYVFKEEHGNHSQWKFFVSHNKVGGFRQVILHRGKIILTRMAQPVGDPSPTVIAGNIEQEMSNTMEYMRRLSFNASEGLDIYIIASESIREAIDTNKFNAYNLHIMTPYEVAERLDIQGATQPADQFGDVVLAASVGSSRKHVLRLFTPEMQKLHVIYQGMLLQRFVAAVAVAVLAVYACMLLLDVYEGYSTRDELSRRKAVQEKNLRMLNAEVKRSGLEIQKTSDFIDLYQQLQKEELVSPLPFIAALERAVQPPVYIKKFDWSMDSRSPDPENPNVVAVVGLEFLKVLDIEAFRPVSEQLMGNLKRSFPGLEIGYTKLPNAFSPDAKLDLNFDNRKKAANSPDAIMEVELTIKGQWITPKPAGEEQ